MLWFCREFDGASFGKRVITKDRIENFLWPKHRDRHYLWATRYNKTYQLFRLIFDFVIEENQSFVEENQSFVEDNQSFDFCYLKRTK